MKYFRTFIKEQFKDSLDPVKQSIITQIHENGGYLSGPCTHLDRLFRNVSFQLADQVRFDTLLEMYQAYVVYRAYEWRNNVGIR